jgi:hypothetical protein
MSRGSNTACTTISAPSRKCVYVWRQGQTPTHALLKVHPNLNMSTKDWHRSEPFQALHAMAVPCVRWALLQRLLRLRGEVSRPAATKFALTPRTGGSRPPFRSGRYSMDRLTGNHPEFGVGKSLGDSLSGRGQEWPGRLAAQDQHRYGQACIAGVGRCSSVVIVAL